MSCMGASWWLGGVANSSLTCRRPVGPVDLNCSSTKNVFKPWCAGDRISAESDVTMNAALIGRASAHGWNQEPYSATLNMRDWSS
jgi:hypothetical protein